jgi:hypothetical protein
MTANASKIQERRVQKAGTGKKRIDAFIISEKIDSVLSSLEALNLQLL